jgi:fatty acid desaturase
LHALGVILHDACHRSRTDDSRAWRLVEMLAGWPIASTIEAMRYHHLRHHAASGTPLDPYYKAVHAGTAWRRYLLILRGVLLPYWWTLRAVVAPFALLVPALRTAYARAFLQDRSGRHLRDHPGVVACARADVLQLAGQALVLGSAVAADLPVVTFYLVPWMLAGVLNARRVVYEHAWRPCTRRSQRETWDTTVDHDLGLIGNALLYPHNIGLHRVHHRYPAVSFVHLRRVADAIRSVAAPQT